MSPASFHLAILRCAAVLVPVAQRTDWLAEWRSELWHIRESHGTNVAAFCMGAFRDAFWLRCNEPIGPRSLLRLDAPAPPAGIDSFPDQGVAALSSPFRCLGWMATLGAASLGVGLLLPAARVVLYSALYPRNLVLISPVQAGGAFEANGFLGPHPTVSRERFESLKMLDGGQFTGLAFYAPVDLPVETPRGKRTLNIVKTTPDLFRILDIPAAQAQAGTPTLILTDDARRKYFDGDLRIPTLPDGTWNLPGRVDGWLIEDDSALAVLPAKTAGFVTGRLRYDTLHDSRFQYIRLADRSFELFVTIPLMFVFSGILWAVMLAGSSGGHMRTAGTPGLRRSLFLVAKSLLVLPIVAFGSLDVTALSGSLTPLFFNVIMFGIFIAARWVITDQLNRCPVCLRFLAHPVRIGGPSRILLEWHGTELMCDRGHGLLYVPEWPALWSGRQRCMGLGPSWGGLFP